MNYEIKIENATEPNGEINLKRLNKITDGLQRIAKGALQIRLNGISISKGRKKDHIEEALNINLSNIGGGSTVLSLNTKPFSETLPIQTDLFREEALKDLPSHSPLSLFIYSFQQALDEQASKDFLDKHLLNELKKFQSAFISGQERVVFSNGSAQELLKLNKEAFQKIGALEKELPDPQPVIVNGKVEELKFSKLKVKIDTAEGPVDGFISEKLDKESIGAYWGKEVTLSGIVHFKPNDKSIIEIEKIYEPDEADQFFSKKPKAESVEEQIERQRKEHGFQNRLKEVIGQWPGDEYFEELQKMLTK